jgi:SAM-dependent methyltransferase
MFRSTAHLYDLIYEAAGKDYALEVVRLRELIGGRSAGAESLLDVACGTGAHLVHLREWYDVAGVDLDPAMLAIARERLPAVELVEADMRTFTLDRRFDVVICLFSSIGYMPSVTDLDTAIANMAAHLEPGGLLIVDGWIRPDAWLDRGSTAIDTAETEDLKVARVARSQRVGTKTRLEMHHLVAGAGGVEYLVDRHELSLFDPEEYEAAFTNAGLRVDVTPSPMPGRDRYVATSP